MKQYLSNLYDDWHHWCERAAQLAYAGQDDTAAVAKADAVMAEIEYYQDAQADADKLVRLPWRPLVSSVRVAS